MGCYGAAYCTCGAAPFTRSGGDDGWRYTVGTRRWGRRRCASAHRAPGAAARHSRRHARPRGSAATAGRGHSRRQPAQCTESHPLSRTPQPRPERAAGGPLGGGAVVPRACRVTRAGEHRSRTLPSRAPGQSRPHDPRPVSIGSDPPLPDSIPLPDVTSCDAARSHDAGKTWQRPRRSISQSGVPGLGRKTLGTHAFRIEPSKSMRNSTRLSDPM